MNNLKISIIVPVYNVEKYLQQFFDSIMTQTFQDFEVLLIDDGSTDKSGEMCDEYAKRENRVRVFHKRNGGVSSARNIGLSEAKGEWIYFSDADDRLYPNTLEMLLKEIGADCAMSIGGYEVYDENGNLVYSESDRDCGIMDKDSALLQMFRANPYIYQGYVWNKLYKREVISNNKLIFDEKIIFNEDRLFNVKYLCALSDDSMIAYNWHPVYQYIEYSYRSIPSVSGTIQSDNQKFDINYITDLQSFEQIGVLFRKIGVNKTIQKAYISAMICSYYWFRSRMYELNIKNRKVEKECEYCLLRGIGLCAYIIMHIKTFARNLLTILKLFPSKRKK